MNLVETRSSFKKATADIICQGLAKGTPLAELCRTEGMPSAVLVRLWLNPKSRYYQGDDFFHAVAVAREMGEDALAEECLRIADDRSHDWVERPGRDGAVERVFDFEHVQRSRLRIDTRLRLLAKFNPRKWGDKIQATHQVEMSLADLVMASYKKPDGDGA